MENSLQNAFLALCVMAQVSGDVWADGEQYVPVIVDATCQRLQETFDGDEKDIFAYWQEERKIAMKAGNTKKVECIDAILLVAETKSYLEHDYTLSGN